MAIAKAPSKTASINAKGEWGATTCDFKVQLSSGLLAGKTFEGFFSYDASILSGQGFETIGLVQGLKIFFKFLNNRYSESDDVRFPDSPALHFMDGELLGLKYAPFDFIFHLNRQSNKGQSAFTYDVDSGEGEGCVSYVQRESFSIQNTSNRSGLGLSAPSWLLQRKAVFPQKV
ncbi:MAG: hypothetical protein HC899_06550 [Leptolyngbyaceae cyanobacterium SM1_4_3]|nr:hypothetical protein [Leptolyngbyaceae cyanobacterium SM1_4_3]